VVAIVSYIGFHGSIPIRLLCALFHGKIGNHGHHLDDPVLQLYSNLCVHVLLDDRGNRISGHILLCGSDLWINQSGLKKKPIGGYFLCLTLSDLHCSLVVYRSKEVY